MAAKQQRMNDNERFVETNPNAIQLQSVEALQSTPGRRQAAMYDIVGKDIESSILAAEVEKSDHRNLTLAWQSAKKEYAKLPKATVEKYAAKGLKKEHIIAIIAYTEAKLDGQSQAMYREMNNSMSNYKPLSKDIIPYYKYISLLYATVGAGSFDASHETLYRGTSIDFTGRVGDIVTFQSFTSTSRKREEAIKFRNAGNPEADTGTIFKINAALGGMYVESLTVYPGEEEVLLPPFYGFKIDDIKATHGGTRREITLTAQPFTFIF